MQGPRALAPTADLIGKPFNSVKPNLVEVMNLALAEFARDVNPEAKKQIVR